MLTAAENDLMTEVEGAAPLGRLIREHYWVPFALSSNLVAGAPPAAVRLFGDDFVAFRAADGRIGFLAERCPHRRASLLLAPPRDRPSAASTTAGRSTCRVGSSKRPPS